MPRKNIGKKINIDGALEDLGNTLSDEDLEKFDGIEENAQKNVQADWNATSGDSFIKNKPTIPPAIIVDSALNPNSTNPVQNNIIYNAFSASLQASNIKAGTNITLEKSGNDITISSTSSGGITEPEVDEKLKKYLPLTGGTLEGNIDLPMDFHLYDNNGNIILFSSGNTSSSLMMLGSKDVTMLINNSSKSIILRTPDGDDYVALRSELSTYLPLSGGTMSGPLVLTGGDAASGVGNMQLDTYGQITAKGTNKTLFGRNGETSLLVGHSSHSLSMRGSATRPTYNSSDMALYSDIPTNHVTTDTTQTISGLKTFSGSSGFNYSGIENATSNTSRNVWFSHTDKKGTPCYNDAFKYNPSTNVLTVGSITGNAATATNATKLNNQDASYYLNYNNFANTPTIPTNNNQLTNGAGFITSAGSMQTLYSGEATSGTITLSQNLSSSSKDLIVFLWINDEDIFQSLAIPESRLYTINSSSYTLAFRSTTASTNKTMTIYRSATNKLTINSNSSSYIKLKNIYRFHFN